MLESFSGPSQMHNFTNAQDELEEDNEVLRSQEQMSSTNSKNRYTDEYLKSMNASYVPSSHPQDFMNRYRMIVPNFSQYNYYSAHAKTNSTPSRFAYKTLLHEIHLQVINGK